MKNFLATFPIIVLMSFKLDAASHEELLELCRSNPSPSILKFIGTMQDEKIDWEFNDFNFVLNSRQRKIIGFTGTLDEPVSFYFGRNGDRGDGNIEEIGAYNVQNYPYNFVFQTRLIGRHDPEAEINGFYAIAGMYVVHSIGSDYWATFKFTQLADGNGRDDIGPPWAGEIEGCIKTWGI